MFSWIKKVLFAVTVCFFELLHIESGSVLSLQYCTVGSLCPNSRIRLLNRCLVKRKTVLRINLCHKQHHLTTNTELSHPNLISMRDERNRIGGLVAWDKNVPTVKGLSQVGCPLHGHWVTRRSAALSKSVHLNPTKSLIQASHCMRSNKKGKVLLEL